MTLTEAHLEYCSTDTQRAAVRAMLEHGQNATHAAAALGVSRSTLRRHLSRVLRRHAATQPEAHAEHAPEGYHLRGVSTLRKVTLDDGQIAHQWVKTDRNHENITAALREEVAEIVEGTRGIIDPAPAPQYALDDLLAVYPLGDAHIGMLAWGRETGEDYDLRIAEDQIKDAIDRAVSSAMPAHRALIIGMGDWWHTDNESNRTERGGNELDADSRYEKRTDTGLRILRWITDRVLRRHNEVTEIILPGNHDRHTAICAKICMRHWYEREPRLSVTAPKRFAHGPYPRIMHGQCFIGAGHGHLARNDRDLVLAFADDYAADWGAKHRHIYLGHTHHAEAKEIGGVMVERVQALCPKDAYAHGGAWRARRGQKVDLWHKEHGRIATLYHEVGA